jgi:hypothetical protein
MDRTEQRLSNSDKPIGIWQNLLLLVLALPLGVILVLALTISGYLLFTQLVPAASAKAFAISRALIGRTGRGPVSI